MNKKTPSKKSFEAWLEEPVENFSVWELSKLRLDYAHGRENPNKKLSEGEFLESTTKE